MQKLFFAIIYLLFFPLLKSKAGNNNDDTIPSFVGISNIPTMNWKVFYRNTKGPTDFLNYHFDLGSQSSYEGNFGIKKIGLKMGLSVDVDNNLVGKAYNYAGYIGLKNYWIRLENSKMSGTVDWAGQLQPGFLSNYAFTHSYFNVDILKSFTRMINQDWSKKVMGFYWGLSYTSLKIPLELNTLVTPGGRADQVYGVQVYDTLFTGKFYSYGFGFNSLRQLATSGGLIGMIKGKPAWPLALYASTEDKFGLGQGKLSDYGKSMAEALNPGKTLVNTSGLTSYLHYSLSVGIRYYKRINPVFLLIACGYDIEGSDIMNMSGYALTDQDLGYTYDLPFFNHGFSVKLYASWIGFKHGIKMGE